MAPAVLRVTIYMIVVMLFITASISTFYATTIDVGAVRRPQTGALLIRVVGGVVHAISYLGYPVEVLIVDESSQTNVSGVAVPEVTRAIIHPGDNVLTGVRPGSKMVAGDVEMTISDGSVLGVFPPPTPPSSYTITFTGYGLTENGTRFASIAIPGEDVSTEVRARSSVIVSVDRNITTPFRRTVLTKYVYGEKCASYVHYVYGENTTTYLDQNCYNTCLNNCLNNGGTIDTCSQTCQATCTVQTCTSCKVLVNESYSAPVSSRTYASYNCSRAGISRYGVASYGDYIDITYPISRTIGALGEVALLPINESGVNRTSSWPYSTDPSNCDYTYTEEVWSTSTWYNTTYVCDQNCGYPYTYTCCSESVNVTTETRNACDPYYCVAYDNFEWVSVDAWDINLTTSITGNAILYVVRARVNASVVYNLSDPNLQPNTMYVRVEIPITIDLPRLMGSFGLAYGERASTAKVSLINQVFGSVTITFDGNTASPSLKKYFTVDNPVASFSQATYYNGGVQYTYVTTGGRISGSVWTVATFPFPQDGKASITADFYFVIRIIPRLTVTVLTG